MENRIISRKIGSLSHGLFRFIERQSKVTHDGLITSTNACIIGFISGSNTDVFQKDIEKELGITRSTASKVIDLMEQKDLVKREKVGHDARLKKIVLTEKSKKIHENMKNDMLQVEKVLVKGFSEKEISTLSDFIDRMESNIKDTTTVKKEVMADEDNKTIA